VSLRNVLRRLVLNNRITKEVFDKADEAARRRKAALELDVLKGRLTIAELERRLKKVASLIKTLGFERHGPSVCLFIAGRRVCDLHPNFVQTRYASYLRNKIFVKEIYTKVATSISSLKKDATAETVQFVRRATTWKKTVIKTNSQVRKAVWATIIDNIVSKNEKIAEYIKRFFALSNKDKVEELDVQKLSANQTKLIKKILLKRFKRTAVRHIRKALKSDKIKVLQLKHKPTVLAPVEIPTRVTREIVRLPADIIKQKDEDIIALLTGRHIVESL
jgi:predicted transcriptional regulator